MLMNTDVLGTNKHVIMHLIMLIWTVFNMRMNMGVLGTIVHVYMQVEIAFGMQMNICWFNHICCV